MTRKRILTTIVTMMTILLLISCSNNPQAVRVDDTSVALAQDVQTAPVQDDGETVEASAETRPEGWSEETHGNSASPDYDAVFPDDEVNRIDITISPDDWQAMMDDMTDTYGEFGSSPSRGEAAGLPQGPPPQGEGIRPQGQAGPMGQGGPMGDPMGGPMGDQVGGPIGEGGTDSNAIWVPASIEFEGHTWSYVGIRFKGNSSLKHSWGSGTLKLPFKLDFDEFEDEHAEIEDQRFYGFKQLALSSNFNDNSLLREKVTADIFREAGVPSARTAFYRLYVDHGDGPVYFGLYTAVEIVDDTVIEEQFEDDGGNVYKPDGRGASFAYGVFNEVSFDKETNSDEADWSDVQALFETLHSTERATDPDTWRGNLESIFDVDGFLKWLAVNTVVQNWDTYGKMFHNYYLYNDPTTGLLTWIPWDNNEALHSGKRGGALSLALTEVDDEWPLIRYLIDDEVYRAQYAAYVEETIDTAFEPQKMAETYRQLHALIRPYVVGSEGEIAGHTFVRSAEVFDAALDDLIEHVSSRYAEAGEYVESQRGF